MSNYKCIVAQISTVIPIPNADRIHTAIVLGEQVIVSKEWTVGKIGLFFPADTQLSEEFCSENNLFRHAHLNKDPSKAGFFDDNRKVRCQPFLKVRSEGFFCGLDALDYTGTTKAMPIGYAFDHIGGKLLCEKYMSEKMLAKLSSNKTQAKSKRRDNTPIKSTPMFEKHVTSHQYRQNTHLIEKGDLVSFHAKVHGTSARVGYTKVKYKPVSLLDRLLAKVGLFDTERWEYIVGSRNVTIDSSGGHHGSNQFRHDVMDKLKPFLKKGMTVYGEIAGYANGKLIMSPHKTKGLKDKKFAKKYGSEVKYTYGCNEGESRFHVYRISYTNESGIELDFTDAQIKQWCLDAGVHATFDVHQPIIFDGDVKGLNALVEYLTERPELLTEDFIDPTHLSEGIIVRVDKGTLVPKFLKSKSYAFKVAEGILKETGDLDLEETS